MSSALLAAVVIAKYLSVNAVKWVCPCC